MPYLVKNPHGVYCVQRKVPEHLQAAVAKRLSNGKSRQVYLKRSLGTKDLKQANVRVKPVLIWFDQVLREATALAGKAPVSPQPRSSLNDAEISRMAEYVYAKALAWDERIKVGGRDELKRIEAEHLRLEGRPMGPWAIPYDALPPYGISPAQLQADQEQLEDDLRFMREALALGDVSAVEDHVTDALDTFGIKLAPSSLSYPKLGIAVLRAYVRALQDIEKRNSGQPVETPAVSPRAARSDFASGGGTLRDAVAGWEKQRVRPPLTVQEYKRAVEMFIQMHGDLPLSQIRKSHARAFIEALQLVPRIRTGKLREAPLPTLSAWGKEHPEAPKVSPSTVNKQMGAVQAIAGWGHHNGIIPDDVSWPDPFHKMRVEEERSGRGPFVLRELQAIFDAPLFTKNESPAAAKGLAGVWLPLLALFTGARQGELAALKASNVREEDNTPLLFIVAERKAGKRLKTKVSERVVPVHPLLAQLGFLEYLAERRRDGEHAWLFPGVAPEHGRPIAAWSKWWSYYLRNTVGIKDTNKVFHSFRHGVKDALRRGGVDLEAREALLGHSGSISAVSRGYGADEMLARWGVTVLRDAVATINYRGLDLSRVQTGHHAGSV
jgi:integrase